MIQLSTSEQDAAVSFANKLVSSESFKSLFRDGMTLVEETAAYLDGEGREDAKNLPRLGALAYATESMRLTTRLMQTASWLLLQRAVNEGELTQTEAASEKRKVHLSEQQTGISADAAKNCRNGLSRSSIVRCGFKAASCTLIACSIRLRMRRPCSAGRLSRSSSFCAQPSAANKLRPSAAYGIF